MDNFTNQNERKGRPMFMFTPNEEVPKETVFKT